MKLRSNAKIIFILITFLAFALYVARPVLEGEGVIYYSAPSSTAEMTPSDRYREKLNINFFPIRAESKFYEGECDVDALLKKYCAHVVEVENVDGIVNYYCRALRLPVGNRLYGREVNLHIAVAEYGYSIGFPFIYGGY